ncbi:MAG: hypothetical protein PHO00_08675, partial [bacterium]|nr:hypothetical protein [bacterium]
MGKYQLTKTIRFKLMPAWGGELKEVEALRAGCSPASKENIASLISRGQELKSAFEAYIKDNEKKRLNPEILIHYRWLKLYTKDLFYAWKKDDTEKKIRIREIEYLPGVFQTFLGEWDDTIRNLADNFSQPEESLARRAEMALSVKQLGAKRLFPFLKDFVVES